MLHCSEYTTKAVGTGRVGRGGKKKEEEVGGRGGKVVV